MGRAFWQSIQVPINEDWEENGLEFVNPTLVADLFAEATSISAELAGKAERLTETIANAEYALKKAERELRRFRRRVMAKHYGRITKSAGADVIDAFFLRCVIDDGLEEELNALEAAVHEAEHILWLERPVLEKIQARLKAVERNMDFAKQYLDFEKLTRRIASNNA